jgi:hypothetical protein
MCWFIVSDMIGSVDLQTDHDKMRGDRCLAGAKEYSERVRKPKGCELCSWIAGDLGNKTDLPEGVILRVCDWDMLTTKLN